MVQKKSDKKSNRNLDDGVAGEVTFAALHTEQKIAGGNSNLPVNLRSFLR